MVSSSRVEFWLRTDVRGRVLSELERADALRAPPPAGSSLAALSTEASAATLLDFLLALRRDGAALSARLEVAGAPPELFLGGVLCEDGALVWASESRHLVEEQGRLLATSPRRFGAPYPTGSATDTLRRLTLSPPGDELSALLAELAEARAEVARLQDLLSGSTAPPR